MATINTNEHFTTSEAAVKLGVSIDTVKKYCQLGRIKATNVGRQWLIHRREIDKYNETRREYNRSKTPPSKD